MNRILALLGMAMLVSACGSIRLVSDYDEVIDRGVTEFSEQLSTHAKNMSELAGKPDGTYEATLMKYNALDSKIEGLITRARNNSDGKICKLHRETLARIKVLMKEQTPSQLQEGTDVSTATENSCSSRLLELARDQLSDIRTIHRDIDKCGPGMDISCLRPATSKDALAIAMQSANAVAIVETAKKSR